VLPRQSVAGLNLEPSAFPFLVVFGLAMNSSIVSSLGVSSLSPGSVVVVSSRSTS
jgi:hypothetical protein